MTIDEAIEILFKQPIHLRTKEDHDFFEAIQLGIEALKRCKVLAQESPLWAAKPLPGEYQG
jgi:hypothetical protein